MANTTVYPYGTGGSLPSSIGIINDLVTGGANKALSAEMGKELNQEINGHPTYEWEAIRLSLYAEKHIYINGGTNKWETGTNWYSKFIPVTAGKTYRIKTGAGGIGKYAWLTSDSYTAWTAVTTYVPGTTVSEDIAINETTDELVAPEGVAYMWVLTRPGTTVDSGITVEEYVSIAPTDGIVAKIATIEDCLQEKTYSWVDAGLAEEEATNGIINGDTLKWFQATNWYAKFLPVTPGNKYKVTAGSGGIAKYAFLTSDAYTIGQAVTTFATGAELSPDILSGETTGELVAPSDAYFLWVLTQSGTSSDNGNSVSKYVTTYGDLIDVSEEFNRVDEDIAELAGSIPGSGISVVEGMTTSAGVYPSLQAAVNACEDNVKTNITIEGEVHIPSTVTIPSTKKVNLIGGKLKGSVQSIGSTRNDTNGVAKVYVGSLMPQWIEVAGKVKYPASSIRTYPYKASFSCSGARNSNVTITFVIPTTDAVKINTAGYSEAWVTVLHNWMAHKFRIDSIDTTTGTVTCSYYNGYQSYHAVTGTHRIIIENINIESAVINGDEDTWQEGTYYFSDGYLFYKYDETETAPDIEIPSVETIIEAEGELGMEGVEVSMTAHDFDDLMGEGQGYRSFQSGFVINGAIDIKGAANIHDCTFTHTTNNAIRVCNSASNVNIVNCTFEETGTDAILVGVTNYIAYNKGQSQYYVPSIVPSNVNIIGNSVHHPGRIYSEATAIAIAYATNFYVGRNVISDTYYTAISTGCDWGEGRQVNSGGIIEGNYIKNIAVGSNALSDGAAYYNLGDEHGLIFRKNIITKTYGINKSSGINIYSLYFDQISQNITAENNVIFDTFGFVFFNVTGERNISINNNIFALPKKAVTSANNNVPSSVVGNIFAWSGNKTNNQSSTGTYVGNLYYRYDESLASVSFDEEAVIGNPGFRDKDNYDFAIVDDTYTSQINFTPISFIAPNTQLVERVRNSPEDAAFLAEWITKWNNGTL